MAEHTHTQPDLPRIPLFPCPPQGQKVQKSSKELIVCLNPRFLSFLPNLKAAPATSHTIIIQVPHIFVINLIKVSTEDITLGKPVSPCIPGSCSAIMRIPRFSLPSLPTWECAASSLLSLRGGAVHTAVGCWKRCPAFLSAAVILTFPVRPCRIPPRSSRTSARRTSVQQPTARCSSHPVTFTLRIICSAPAFLPDGAEGRE